MKSRWALLFLIFAGFVAPVMAQQPDPVEPPGAPAKPFAKAIPPRTSWTTTIHRPAQEQPRPQNDAESNAAGLREEAIKLQLRHQIEKIEGTFDSRVLREVIHFADGSSMTRYTTLGTALYRDRESDELIFDIPVRSDPWSELSWVSEKYYEGTTDFLGKSCDVYRIYASEIFRQEDPEGPLVGAARSELSESTQPIVLSTAYIDRETQFPVAQEMQNFTRFYTSVSPFVPFSMPTEFQEAIQMRAKAHERQRQRYNIGR